MSGPIAVRSSNPSPTCIPLNACVSEAPNLSEIDSSTNTRDPAVHICPDVVMLAARIPATTLCWSASAKTTLGDFPPSSSVIGWRARPAAAATSRPVAALPVNATMSTRGLPTNADPTVGPSPRRQLTTPIGTSAALSMRLRAWITIAGVSSAGLMTQALPAASAGASDFASKINGQFHGVIIPTTPIGS